MWSAIDTVNYSTAQTKAKATEKRQTVSRQTKTTLAKIEK
jgi:hypothetical protein